jgi:cytochrome c
MEISMENLNTCANYLPAKKFFLKLAQITGLVLTVGWMIGSPVKSYAVETNGLGLCPQSREKTPKAPEEYIQKINPLEKNEKNLKKGRLLYMVKAKTLQCKHCHGLQGDGRGGMASDSFPAPRNFTCTEMMKNIPDGQLFWAIGNGLPHTSMPSYDNLSDKQIWQLLIFIRSLSE